jgi:hypothetical protein
MLPRLSPPVCIKTLFGVLLLMALPLTGIGSAIAQEAAEPPVSLVSLYRIAPGQHVAFLEWIATQQAASEAAGAPATQWFMHMDGDSWDFLGIAPETTDEQDEAIDAALEAQGLPTGARAAIEFRQYVAWHTDTYAAGPMSISELLEAVRGQ